jgi:hypothetical protein
MVVVAVQVVAHELPEQPKLFGHIIMVEPWLQLPAPSQAVSRVTMLPVQERSNVHPVVPAGHSSHWPPIAHLPSFLHVDAGCIAHCPLGSIVPPITVPHVPLEPLVSDPLQDWHLPLQVLLQQKPPTQNPDWHSLAVAQMVPFVSFIKHWFEPQK